MRRKGLSAQLERTEEGMKQDRAAFERMMSSFDRFEARFERLEQRWERSDARWEARDARWEEMVKDQEARRAADEARWAKRAEEQKAEQEEREARWAKQEVEREARWAKQREEGEARWEGRDEELKQYIRESNLRVERVVQEMVRHSSERQDRFEAQITAMTKVIMVEVKEFRAESKVHREALLALIDRLPPAAAA